jgi:FixJ family two-component response regulator
LELKDHLNIFLSAHASADDERRALQAGAIQFLQKPASKEVLLIAIRKALKTTAIEE